MAINAMKRVAIQFFNILKSVNETDQFRLHYLAGKNLLEASKNYLRIYYGVILFFGGFPPRGMEEYRNRKISTIMIYTQSRKRA